MFTAFFCPILWVLSSAWIRIAGVQWSYANKTVEAAVRVNPTPIAVILSKATFIMDSSWNWSTFFLRV